MGRRESGFPPAAVNRASPRVHPVGVRAAWSALRDRRSPRGCVSGQASPGRPAPPAGVPHRVRRLPQHTLPWGTHAGAQLCGADCGRGLLARGRAIVPGWRQLRPCRRGGSCSPRFGPGPLVRGRGRSCGVRTAAWSWARGRVTRAACRTGGMRAASSLPEVIIPGCVTRRGPRGRCPARVTCEQRGNALPDCAAA